MTLYIQTTGTPNGSGSFDIIQKKHFPDATSHLPRAEAEALGKPFWLEWTRNKPAFDPLTHHKPHPLDPVLTDTTWTENFEAPVAKTQVEIDADLSGEQTKLMRDWSEYQPIIQLLLRNNFRQQNFIRVLEGKVAKLEDPVNGKDKAKWSLSEFKDWLGKLWNR